MAKTTKIHGTCIEHEDHCDHVHRHVETYTTLLLLLQTSERERQIVFNVF